MIQVCVERDAVAIEQLVPLALAEQNDLASLDQGRLAAPRLVPRGIPRATGDRSRRQRVAGELRALAGQRRGQDLVAVAGHRSRTVPALTGAHDGDRAVLVEAQQLREPE